MAALDSHGKQFEQATRSTDGYLAARDHGSPRTVVLRPGEAASSVIEGTSVGGRGNCQEGRAFLITPPNTTKSTRVAFTGYFCDLLVHPVVKGAER